MSEKGGEIKRNLAERSMGTWQKMKELIVKHPKEQSMLVAKRNLGLGIFETREGSLEERVLWI